MAKAKGGLGKGLEALFADNSTDSGAVSSLADSEIAPNPCQPRRHFDEAALAELADSIRQYGVLQPLVVRPMESGGYQLVAGERRWRAARMAGLSQVPVVIRELIETFGLTQEQVSERVGKSRPVITNAMRLLGLPDAVRALVSQGELSAGHARALLGLENEAVICALAEEIIKKGWSVRQTEAFVKRQKQAEKAEEEAPRTAWDNSTFAEVQLALMQSLSRKVRVE